MALKNSWNKLDNAAKIYPAAISRSDTQVFRFSCELNEAVDGVVLQKALEQTLEVYDYYSMVLKRGMFWYYLEQSDIQPIVDKEHNKLCHKLYNRNKKSLLFEVSYYHNRINLEICHILSDGTGALNFLTAITVKYLTLRHNLPAIELDYTGSRSQMNNDSFSHYYSGAKNKGEKLKNACVLKGARYWDDNLRVITGHLSVKEVLKLAHESGVTMSVYLSALMLKSIADTLSVKDKKKPIILCVPVNLRNFFPSQSLRNFFGTIYVSYNFSQSSNDFADILESVKDCFKKNLTMESRKLQLDSYSKIEHNPFAKIAPLPLKDICLRFAYDINMKKSTASLSNIGVVKFSPELDKFVKAFDVCTGTNKLMACVCSYNDTLSISFTTPFISSDIERAFFTSLTSQGLSAVVYTNMSGGEQ